METIGLCQGKHFLKNQSEENKKTSISVTAIKSE